MIKSYFSKKYFGITKKLSDLLKAKPELALITGSGIADTIDDLIIQKLPAEDIFPLKTSLIEGHKKDICLLEYEGKIILAFTWKNHIYEGYSLQDVLAQTAVCHYLGIKKIIFTNAAGGLNQNFSPGDIMLVNDQINLTGRKVSAVLSPEAIFEQGLKKSIFAVDWHEKLKSDLSLIGICIKEGTLAEVTGPNYETPAEVRMLNFAGAGAVGMSNVPEMLFASALGMDVISFSLITNILSELPQEELTHSLVLKNAKAAEKNIAEVIKSSIMVS